MDIEIETIRKVREAVTETQALMREMSRDLKTIADNYSTMANVNKRWASLIQNRTNGDDIQV